MIELENVTFTYKKEDAGSPGSWLGAWLGVAKNEERAFELHSINLRVPRGERLGVIGPSGAGKSTLLKVIGGHARLNGGSVRLDGVDISQLEPGHRNVLTVFQDHALFPHLTAYQNVEFPLSVGGMKRADRFLLANEYMERFGIWHLRDKKPAELSGGERQRTALARALVAKPSVLLLDEPTASLDSAQKSELALLLNESANWPTTPAMIIVTHDHYFAMSLCHRLAILKDGRLIANGDTEHVVSFPPNAVAAQILNNHNVIYGYVDSSLVFRSRCGSVEMQLSDIHARWVDSHCAAVIPSDALTFDPTRTAGAVSFSGSIRAIQFQGVYTRVIVDVGREMLFLDVPRRIRQPPVVLKQRVKLSVGDGDVRIVPLAHTPSADAGDDGQGVLDTLKCEGEADEILETV